MERAEVISMVLAGGAEDGRAPAGQEVDGSWTTWGRELGKTKKVDLKKELMNSIFPRLRNFLIGIFFSLVMNSFIFKYFYFVVKCHFILMLRYQGIQDKVRRRQAGRSLVPR